VPIAGGLLGSQAPTQACTNVQSKLQAGRA
jgi:hypothetical protein